MNTIIELDEKRIKRDGRGSWVGKTEGLEVKSYCTWEQSAVLTWRTALVRSRHCVLGHGVKPFFIVKQIRWYKFQTEREFMLDAFILMMMEVSSAWNSCINKIAYSLRVLFALGCKSALWDFNEWSGILHRLPLRSGQVHKNLHPRQEGGGAHDSKANSCTLRPLDHPERHTSPVVLLIRAGEGVLPSMHQQ